MRSKYFYHIVLSLFTAAVIFSSCSDETTKPATEYTDDDPRGAVKIEVPHMETYTIDGIEDIDWFRIPLEANISYKFTSISETDVDIDFYLYGPGTSGGTTGDEIAYDDDSGEGSQPMIEFNCETEGYYYLRVSEYTNDPSKNVKQTLGNYDLIVNVDDKLFARAYGGTGNDWAMSSVQTAEGGYIIASYTESFGAGGSDALLTKILPDGTEQWSKAFGGTGDDWAISVKETAGGDIVILGTTYSYGTGNSDMWLIKTDGSGNQLWSKTYGGEYYEYGFDLALTADGGFIAAGYTNTWGAGGYDAMILKLDSDGNQDWGYSYGGISDEYIYSVIQTDDGNYAFGGETYSFGAGKGDVWLVKLNSTGNQLWAKTFGGAYEDWAMEIAATDDGGIIVGATKDYSEDPISYPGMWIIKTDTSGNQDWERTYSGLYDDYCRSIKEVTDGGFIIAGETFSYGVGGSDFWLIKTDNSGFKDWSKTFGGISEEWPNEVFETSDGGFLMAGGTESFGAGYSDIWVLKTDANGNTSKDMPAPNINPGNFTGDRDSGGGSK